MKSACSHRRCSFGVQTSLRPLVLAVLAGTCSLISACGPGLASPIPQPPTLIANLGVAEPEPFAHGQIVLQGRPGTVPAGAQVRATLLDGSDPPLVTIAAADGSFAIGFVANPGEEVRLEWLSDAVRSPPLDAVLAEVDAGLAWAAARRFDCVSLTPGYLLELAPGALTPLTFDSDCAELVTIADPRLRLGSTDFALESPLPASLSPGSSASLDVDFQPTDVGLREDILFLSLTVGPETIRYPVSLIAGQ